MEEREEAETRKNVLLLNGVTLFKSCSIITDERSEMSKKNNGEQNEVFLLFRLIFHPLI